MSAHQILVNHSLCYLDSFLDRLISFTVPRALIEDQFLSVHVPRISCNGFPVLLLYHPCGWQGIFTVQVKPCVQHTLMEAVLLQGPLLDTEPLGL